MKIKSLLLLSALLVTMMSFKCKKELLDVKVDQEFSYIIDIPSVPTKIDILTPICLKKELINWDSIAKANSIDPATFKSINIKSVGISIIDPGDSLNFNDFDKLEGWLTDIEDINAIKPNNITVFGSVTVPKDINTMSFDVNSTIDVLPNLKSGSIIYAYSVITNKANTKPLKARVKMVATITANPIQ